MKKKALFNWSGGKDSSLALYKTLQNKDIELTSLLTSLNEKHRRISMHGVHEDLLDAQAESIGLPLAKMFIPENATMGDYEKVMIEALSPFQKQGVEYSVFGDIFLEDLKEYREKQLAKINWKAEFPLWKIPTQNLIEEFLALGFKTMVCCVNEKYLSKDFVGITIDDYFIKQLPKNVDVCGENGEFHTFVYDGPIFKKPLEIQVGEKVRKTYAHADEEHGFWFCEILKK